MTSTDAKLEELRAEHLKASNYAAEMLRKYGADSPQFIDADRIAADISSRIDALGRKR
jgi:hypothetical protein